jgi:serine/threonine protein kinase
MSETSSKCNRCGAPLPPDAPEGLCPRCLVALNLATQTDVTGETGPHGTAVNKPSPTPPLPPAEIAKLFPQLEILECLGRGGMGAVYKARQPRLDRLVALKILSPEKQDDPKFAERFEREARALARLSHPNIVTVYDFGEVGQASSLSPADGQTGRMPVPLYYLLMEFVDGLTLRQLFHTRKLAPAEALDIVPKICEALQYAHNEGIVHRDIKPENILLDKQGRVKIADFGIAKIIGQTPKDVSLTGAKDVVGTPHYMAPEQIEKPQTVDHRADIYSLGVVFYEMLTGELPLGKFQPPSSCMHGLQIDVRLDEVVLRALEKEPARRYQQASVLKTEVETIAGSPVAPAAPTAAGKSEAGIPLFPRSFGLTFTSRIALKVARAGWILGCLAALGFIPELKWMFAFSGFFGLIGLAVFIELVHRSSHGQASRSRVWSAAAVMVLVMSLVVISTTCRFYPVKSDYIGQTWFPKDDSIEITSVKRTKDQMVVKGHYNLVSHDQATLALYITSTNKNVPEDATQRRQISKGRGDFELIDFHIIPGLPHVSMYADGRPFAALYFGTKAEALEESKANGITNATPASAETWSPTLQPGEKPDLQKILTEAKELTDVGHYEEALQHHIWYHNHALEFDQGQTGVRLSFALSQWVELGRRYPKAKQALIEIRDHDTQKLAGGEGYFNLFMDVSSINRELQDEDATYTLFKTIQAKDPKLAQQCYYSIEDLLVRKGEYELCLKYIGDPQAKFEMLQHQFDMLRQLEQRHAAMQHEHPMPSGFPDTTESTKKIHENLFVGQVRQLIEILVATDHKADAEKIRDQAVAILDDPRLQSAVSDAELKIQKRNTIQTLAEQPPVVVETQPLSGARDIQPGETEIRVRFSKEMADGSWSWSTAWENSTPEIIGQSHYETDQRTCVLKAKLEPGRTYAWWLNSDRFKNFTDRAGRPAVPYLLIFQTKQN